MTAALRLIPSLAAVTLFVVVACEFAMRFQ
jgi:hypothetical protein